MRRYLLGKKHKVSVLRLNNKLGLGKRLPSLKQKDNEMENVNRLNDEEIYYDTWGSLFGHTRKIHGNEKRIFDNVKVNEENEALRKNRLELINMLCKTFQNFINFQLLKAQNE